MLLDKTTSPLWRVTNSENESSSINPAKCLQNMRLIRYYDIEREFDFGSEFLILQLASSLMASRCAPTQLLVLFAEWPLVWLRATFYYCTCGQLKSGRSLFAVSKLRLADSGRELGRSGSRKR